MRISTLIVFTMLVAFACSSRTNLGTAGSQAATVRHSVQVSFLESSASKTFTKADFDQHILQLKPRLPSEDFSIVVQPPFVVIGDEPHDVVKERAAETIKWAVEKLKQDYFPNDPSEILDIWLFKNELSYRKYTGLLFNDKPSTPYGYYSRVHKALIMNIATGGGTLVHELVHPFIEANFPECPSWLNEGLGSLYEQCAEQDGHIYGFVNWRLPGLQDAVKAGNLISFKELTALDNAGFYSDNRGVNYAQARYLCYYLQEKGLLVKFYRRFQANQRSDPTGYKTLVSVLGNPNMERFQKDWEKYVLELNEDFRLQPAN